MVNFSYDIRLEFSAAIFGAEKEFELSHLETCEACAGTGAKTGSKMRICSTCGGRGQVMRTEQTPFGMFSQVFQYFFFPTNGMYTGCSVYKHNACLLSKCFLVYLYAFKYSEITSGVCFVNRTMKFLLIILIRYTKDHFLQFQSIL